MSPLGRQSHDKHAHRDVPVLGEDGLFLSKATTIGVFRGLEPRYGKLEVEESTDILSSAFVTNAAGEYGLWLEPMQNLCEVVREQLLRCET